MTTATETEIIRVNAVRVGGQLVFPCPQGCTVGRNIVAWHYHGAEGKLGDSDGLRGAHCYPGAPWSFMLAELPIQWVPPEWPAMWKRARHTVAWPA